MNSEAGLAAAVGSAERDRRTGFDWDWDRPIGRGYVDVVGDSRFGDV